MTDFLGVLDDPNDPAPELELLEEWERLFSHSHAKFNKDTKPLSDDEILAMLHIDVLPEGLAIQGLPKDEYMSRYEAAMKAEDWEAIAELWHTDLNYGLIRTLETLKARHEESDSEF